MTGLGALLLNPPLTSGTRTLSHLGIAAELLGCDALDIANLFAVATRDVTAINDVGLSSDGWEAARPRLRQVIAESDHLLAGWGVSSLAGRAAIHRQSQVDYVRACARDVGKDCIWTLNGEPRHPSRWHQYVSDRHGRANGESLAERLWMVLTPVRFETLCRKQLRLCAVGWPSHIGLGSGSVASYRRAIELDRSPLARLLACAPGTSVAWGCECPEGVGVLMLVEFGV